MAHSADSRRGRLALAATALCATLAVVSVHWATAGGEIRTNPESVIREADSCTGDCNGDGKVTVDELLTMVNVALGSGDVTSCTAGDSVVDGRITVDELVEAVGNALNGCPSAPTPTPDPTGSPAGPIQIASLAFGNLLPLVGDTFPSVDSFVSTAIAEGLDPILDQLAAAEPSIWERIANGVRLDFGSGTPQPVGTMTGKITATYSNVVKTDGSVSFDGTISTENLTVNGAAVPMTGVNATVNASTNEGGTSTLSITLTGTGSNPPATASGNVLVDSTRCLNYPVGGSVTATIGGVTTTIRFNDNCNGTFGFSSQGLRQVNFLLNYFNCSNQWWYSSSNSLVAENGHLVDDLSDEEPPWVHVTGTLSDTEVDMNWDTCSTSPCDGLRLHGSFVGHLWKEEEESEFGFGYLARYFIGTYTSHTVSYNEDGTVHCEDTHVFDEQDGIDDIYHFVELRPK